MTVETETKTCICCGKVKDIDEFYTNGRNKDNHLNTCKECHKKKMRKYTLKCDKNSILLKAIIPKGLYTMFKIALKEKDENIDTVIQSYMKEYIKNSYLQLDKTENMY